jgi:hypothetical protein
VERALPVTLTLPLNLQRRPRRRRLRARRLAIGALLVLLTALLGAGFWLPAKAELARHVSNRTREPATEGAPISPTAGARRRSARSASMGRVSLAALPARAR